VGEHGEHRLVVRRAALAAAVALGPAGAAALECSVALVLALDVSASVDAREYDLQMQGLAAALRDEAVIETILTPPGSGVMVSAFLWSGYQHQEVVVDWRWLGDEAAILGFADAISRTRRSHDHWPTALGRAVFFAAQMHQRNPVPCQRRVVDVSGDGVNNDGVGPEWHRSRGTLDGLTVNGLVIRGAQPDPAAYYREHLLTGPGAFLEVIDSYDDFAPAILRKLLRELQPPFAALR
jgi:hypothetical protein